MIYCRCSRLSKKKEQIQIMIKVAGIILDDFRSGRNRRDITLEKPSDNIG